MKNKMKTPTLFLHYGPGGNSDIEKLWFGDKFQDVEFWNQPTIESGDNSFSRLVMACEEKAKAVEAQGAEVCLWGHSFGCNIALEIANREKVKIKKMILSSPLSNIPMGFYRMGKKHHADPTTPRDLLPDLAHALKKFEDNPEAMQAGLMWEVVQVVARDPAYPRLYWHSPELFSKFVSLASKCPALDLAMWSDVLQSCLKTSKGIPKSKNKIETEIFLGEFDPYIELSAEEKFWKSQIGHAKVEVIRGAGHFCHLERK